MTMLFGVAGLLVAWTGAILAYQHGDLWVVVVGVAVVLAAACREASL